MLICLLLLMAGPLAVVDPTIAQTDGGTPLPATFTHVPGEIVFFTFQVQGFQLSPDQKIRLRYKLDAFDPQGVRIMEPVEAPIDAEITPQDKEWKPKVRREITIPPLAASGRFKILVAVTDELARTNATREVPLEVRGRDVPPSETLVIRNFRFYRSEEDRDPLAKPAYRPGDAVWARFDIIGYKFGEQNSVDVNYGIAVLNAAGKVLWSQAEAAAEKSHSFYPKRYVPGSMSLNLQSNIRPGEYTIAVTARDAIGNQTFEARQNFSVE